MDPALFIGCTRYNYAARNSAEDFRWPRNEATTRRKKIEMTLEKCEASRAASCHDLLRFTEGA